MGIVQKLRQLSWSEIRPLFKQAKKRSGRSSISIMRDLYACYQKSYTWADYFAYDFANHQDEEYRKSFICVNRHYPLITKALGLSKEDNDFFNDKGLFNRNFADIRGVESLDLRVDGVEALEAFLANHEIFFVKTADGMGGKGVKRMKKESFVNKSAQEIYDALKSQAYVIVEEAIRQHKEVSKLSQNAVNTLRVVTCKDKDGKYSIPFVASRIAVTDAYVDNGSMGGAYCILSDEGLVEHNYFTHLPILKEIAENPFTGFSYKGFQFPFYQEALDLCLLAAKRCKGHYIGWDVAIGENGPIIIEANTAPTPQLFQAVSQLEKKRGRLDELEKALKVDLHYD